MEGNWQDLTPEESSHVMQKLRSHGDALNPYLIRRRSEWPAPVDPSRLRKLAFPCYDNVVLIEGEIRKAREQPGVLTFLLHDRGISRLKGRQGVERIRRLNTWNRLQLHTPVQAAAYLKFVIGVMDPGDGNFRVVEEAHSTDWRTDVDRVAHVDLEQAIRPLEIRKKGDNWIRGAII